MSANEKPILVIHGGAGVMPGHNYNLPAAFMVEILNEGRSDLQSGMSALELVVTMVARMEVSGLFFAGKGSAANETGRTELDASVMTGHDQKAGAVAAVCNVVHPIKLAQAVMEKTPHVMLSGSGAEAFAAKQGLALVNDPAYYRAATELTAIDASGTPPEALTHGTVGAVALDRAGRLAAATSTGGLLVKMHGRVGDTPVIGAGTWADEQVAVSSTGVGEYIIRAALAHDVAARMAYLGLGIHDAAQAAIEQLGTLGGEGGLIAVDAKGQIAMPFNSRGMKRGYVDMNGAPIVQIY